jgi:hypothetical protein
VAGIAAERNPNQNQANAAMKSAVKLWHKMGLLTI